MKYLTIPEAQANLANLIERVCAGEEITLTRNGMPVVRMEATNQSSESKAPVSPEQPPQRKPRKKR